MCLISVRSMEKCLTWGREVVFPTNPDLVDNLGDMDFDFESFNLLICWVPNLQVPRFPEIWPGPGLGRARLGGVGPGGLSGGALHQRHLWRSKRGVRRTQEGEAPNSNCMQKHVRIVQISVWRHSHLPRSASWRTLCRVLNIPRRNGLK